ncbi:MAG: formylglycine-generating enzyme family protein [Spirochaetia bacterium]|nr:formylglycine-generating enzyme family protein [Spirochaetia bacterium]
MKQAGILLIFPLLLILNLQIFSESSNFIKIGEINRIDAASRAVEVILFDARFIELVKKNDKLLVMDTDLNMAGTIKITSIETINNNYIIHCESLTSNKNFYAGEFIAIKINKTNQSMSKDESNKEKMPDKEYKNQKDSSQMVLIPEGAFIFGSDIPGTDHYTTPIENELTEIQAESGNKRARYLNLNSYYIDKYEITVEQFKKFLIESGTQPPPSWDENVDPGLPVSNLSYYQAENYCHWAGKRLPTELEWEKATRGSGILSTFTKNDVVYYREKINIYPSGLEFDKNSCITRETTNALENVYHLTDKNYYGIYGTCGNAAEWTSSWLLPYKGNSIKNINYGRKYKVIRGGAYNLPSKWTKGYERMIGGIPSLKEDFRAGVRCVRDIR